MTMKQDGCRDALTALHNDQQWTGFLGHNSGLPGPRANLELIEAFAGCASGRLIRRMLANPDEFLASCGAVGLGRLVAEAHDDDSIADILILRELAQDDRWRVREAVAMALQRIGDSRSGLMRSIVARWAVGPEPLVARAAVAGICEPRLLACPETARAALEACSTATHLLRTMTDDQRRTPNARTLRQGLGYCWSVAIAACPAPGLAAFSDLTHDAKSDSDLEWIVKTNRSKARLVRLL